MSERINADENSNVILEIENESAQAADAPTNNINSGIGQETSTNIFTENTHKANLDSSETIQKLLEIGVDDTRDKIDGNETANTDDNSTASSGQEKNDQVDTNNQNDNKASSNQVDIANEPTSNEIENSNSSKKSSSTSSSSSDEENKESSSRAEDKLNDSSTDTKSFTIHEPEPTSQVRSPQTSRTSRRKAPRYTSKQSRDDILEIDPSVAKRHIDNMMKTGKKPENSLIPSLHQYAEQEMTNAAFSGKYDYASKMERASEMLQQFMKTSDNSAELAARKAEYDQRAAINKQLRDRKQEEWNQRINDLKEKHRQRVKKLEEKNADEISEFEAHWADEQTTQQYNKPSPRLLSMRRQEETLALSKYFSQANVIRAEADQLEAEETQMAKQRAVASMRLQYEKMIIRQEKELKGIEALYQRDLINMENQKQKELLPLEMITNRYIEQSRNIGQAEVRTGPIISRPLRNSGNAFTLRAPQTLKVGGLNMKQYIRLKKPVTPTKAKSARSVK